MRARAVIKAQLARAFSVRNAIAYGRHYRRGCSVCVCGWFRCIDVDAKTRAVSCCSISFAESRCINDRLLTYCSREFSCHRDFYVALAVQLWRKAIYWSRVTNVVIFRSSKMSIFTWLSLLRFFWMFTIRWNFWKANISQIVLFAFLYCSASVSLLYARKRCSNDPEHHVLFPRNAIEQRHFLATPESLIH